MSGPYGPLFYARNLVQVTHKEMQIIEANERKKGTRWRPWRPRAVLALGVIQNVKGIPSPTAAGAGGGDPCVSVVPSFFRPWRALVVGLIQARQERPFLPVRCGRRGCMLV